MTAVVEAAVIAAVSTGVIAVVGYGLTAWTTTRTLRANRETARDERLWDKQAEVYQEMFTYASHRAEVRKNRLRTIRYQPEVEAALQAEMDAYQPPPWIAFRGRVTTFASPEVSRAFEAAHQADESIWTIWQEREEAKDLAQADRAAVEPGAVAALTVKITALASAANRADQALYEAARSELHGDIRPSVWTQARMLLGRPAGRPVAQDKLTE